MVYKNYITKSIIVSFLLVIFLIIGVSWITQVFKLLYLIDNGVSLISFIQITILILPLLIFTTAPIATVIAVLYIYNKLIQEKQIFILKNSGLNNLSIAFPAILFAFYITAVTYYISIEALPNSYQKLRADLNLARNSLTSSLVKEKVFNKLSKNINIYIDFKSVEGLMNGMIIFDKRIEKKPVLIIAKAGKFRKDQDDLILELFDGSRQAYDANNNLTELQFNLLSIKISDEKHNSKPVVKRDANEHYIRELLQFEMNNKNRELTAQGHQRIIWPLYNFALTFLALGLLLGYTQNRKSEKINIIKIAFIIALITSIHFTSINYAAKNTVAIYGCYLNIILTIGIGMYSYHRKVL